MPGATAHQLGEKADEIGDLFSDLATGPARAPVGAGLGAAAMKRAAPRTRAPGGGTVKADGLARTPKRRKLGRWPRSASAVG
jgi:hypothetical protein